MDVRELVKVLGKVKLLGSEGEAVDGVLNADDKKLDILTSGRVQFQVCRHAVRCCISGTKTDVDAFGERRDFC